MNTDEIETNLQKPRNPLIRSIHLKRAVAVYVRQSSLEQTKENTGSTQFQRDQRSIALSLGWKQSQIVMVEDDLGISAAGKKIRPGFERIKELIRSREMGAVIAANNSRLARNQRELIELLMVSASYDCLLIIDGKVVNPRDFNDIFLSQILGSVAEYENKLRAKTMHQARMAKARRGHVVSSVPVGFVKRSDGSYDKDPEVKEIIETVISTFRNKRSIRQTVVALRGKNILVPSRARKGKIQWKLPSIDVVRSIITNPCYAGIYSYNKTELDYDPNALTDYKMIRRRRPEEQWIKTVNKLPAYMTVQEQEQFRVILRSNAFSEKHRPGHGSALAQGIVLCGNCGSRMTVSY